jgi:hypothetical protein
MFDEVMNLVADWSREQLTTYIEQLEIRIVNLQRLIKELKALRKRKTKKVYDTGKRGG